MSQPVEHGQPRSGAAQEGGVIHDIGFRHYDGPRLGRGYLLRSLYVESLKGGYGLGRSAKSKIFPFILLGVMTVPALFAVIGGLTGATELPVQYTAYPSVMWPVIAIFVAAQAPASVSRDLRFRVMPLYLSRPLTRNDYVLAKFAALTTAVYILIALPLCVLYADALLTKLPFWANTRGLLGALVGAAMFAVLLSAIGLLIASITPKRGFGVAAVITVIVLLTLVGGSLQKFALDEGNLKLAGYLGAIAPFSLVDGVQVWLFGADAFWPAAPPGTTGGVVFALITVALVAICYSLLLLRYRKVSAS
jgi:ABC-2 type transport system permease protein